MVDSNNSQCNEYKEKAVMKDADFTALAQQAHREGIDRFVVGAIIEVNGAVLLLQRPHDDFMGGIYELPSGKVEDGEQLDVALHREVDEETGLKVEKIIRFIGSFDYRSKSGRSTRQLNFVVSVNKPEPIRLTEHDDHVWATEEELQTVQVTESVNNLLHNHWKPQTEL